MSMRGNESGRTQRREPCLFGEVGPICPHVRPNEVLLTPPQWIMIILMGKCMGMGDIEKQDLRS